MLFVKFLFVVFVFVFFFSFVPLSVFLVCVFRLFRNLLLCLRLRLLRHVRVFRLRFFCFASCWYSSSYAWLSTSSAFSPADIDLVHSSSSSSSSSYSSHSESSSSSSSYSASAPASSSSSSSSYSSSRDSSSY